ncbi:hypothetical protein GCM10023189_16540 [Nibrella saemangeumensis]|uniref:Glycosyltransferase family 1 protein n=1 Tax=Nibrella saemangeumensis TaxID=1084526 RepID=A0ABP8MPW2_9BACT
MATIVIGSYMVRYPLGGNLSWALQYLVGFKELGHEVYMVEKYAYPNSCYNPVEGVLSDDCTYGVKIVSDLLARYGLVKNWCFVENGDIYHGLSREQVNDIFRRADVYIESGAHGSWEEESALAGLRVYIDVDPAYSHIRLDYALKHAMRIPVYDRYFTNGMNVGKTGNIIPTGGINWGYIFNPVSTSLFNRQLPPVKAPYSTIMNWKSYDCVEYNGVVYGHKDIEFTKFVSLPQLVDSPLEVAVSGINGDTEQSLKKVGWQINNAQAVTFTFDTFQQYLSSCRGEFSVCKNMYTATQSGWFSDKSAAYMASGRPVVVQDTGFSDYLPVGEGLFAVNDVTEAQLAIETIESNYQWHCQKAYEIACEYLESKKVLSKFLSELGV